jgi:hypothetical protein
MNLFMCIYAHMTLFFFSKYIFSLFSSRRILSTETPSPNGPPVRLRTKSSTKMVEIKIHKLASVFINVLTVVY